MPIGNAIKFIKTVGRDTALRQLCNSVESRPKLLGYLGFSDEEFDEAFRNQLLKCQTEEQASELNQIRIWFMLL